MRSLIDFESDQPFATRFFTHTLASNQLANAYVLRSKYLSTAYKMILRLAQIINCENRPDATHACGQCQPCRWIEGNAHPGIITVSNLTYLTDVDPETGASKTKTGRAQQSIVVDQVKSLLKELQLHSGGFRRVVVLSGANEGTGCENKTGPDFPPPRDWHPKEEGNCFTLMPLDRRIFAENPSNRFLKTLEEPPPDVVFFLLTDAEDKLLNTIVSRCQIVPFLTPRAFYRTPIWPEAGALFEALLQEGLSGGDFLSRMQRFFVGLAEIGLSASDGLTQFQQFLLEQIRNSPSDREHFERLQRYIRQFEHAKEMIRDRVREEAVLEDLFLQMRGR